MEIRSVFIFSIFMLISVQRQVLDNQPTDVILIGDSNTGAVCNVDISNNYSYVYTVFSNWIYPYDIDYDPIDAVIYWVDGNWKISSGLMSGNSEMTLRLFNGLAQTHGITVDPLSRLLFYTDLGNDIIAAINLEGFLHKTVISSGLVNPGAIVTDPINGTIYWADFGSPAKIEKSNYDGTNRQEIVNTGLSAPYGLDIDIKDGVLYWCDANTFTIEGANVDGSNRHLIYQEQETISRCSIALYKSYLYFTKWWQRNAIMRIGTDGSGITSVAALEDIYPLAIHVNIYESIGINGCSNSGCSHFCFPLPGGNKKCACPDLMILQPDGQTCRKDDLLYDVILVAYSGYGAMHLMDIKNNYSFVNIPLQNRDNIYDIDYDPTSDVIYSVNGNRHIISRLIFGSNETTLRSLNGIAQTYGIALDSISRLLFYTDMGNDIIAAISLDGSLQKTIISSGLVNPRAIVTDPINGTIYWVDSGSPAKIEKSNYDGTNRQEVVNTGLSTPYGLDVDFNAGVLYWCDISTPLKIEGANVNGSNRYLIYQEQVTTYSCSIALYQSYIYFTWLYRYAVMRIGTDGSGLISFATTALMYPRAIHVNIDGRTGVNGCSNGGGGCSHFCFPLPDGSNLCACPDLMALQPDGVTCKFDNLPDNFLLITDGSKRSIYRMDLDNYSYVSIPLQNSSNPYAIDYDPNAAVMFWTDGNLGQINSGSIYGNNQTTLQGFKNYAVLSGIAVDLTSRIMFYIDSRRSTIGVISLDEDLNKTVISNDLNSPQAIVTDPINGTIYWSSLNKIEKSNYDGTNREEVINTGLDVSVDLTVDINVGVMYWCHYRTRKIEQANLDGSRRQVLYQDQISIYKCSIALHQSNLYYSDSASSALMRIGTDGSGMTAIGPSIFTNVMDIHVHSNKSKNQGTNGCSNGRGGCSHFCFPLPGGSKVCDCPDYMILQPDRLSCGNYTFPENLLLIMDQYNREISLMDIPNYRYVIVAHTNMFNPYAITYNPIDKLIYWTDMRFRQILSVSIHGGIQRTIRQLRRSANPVGIAVDALSRVLFYTDSANRIIAALSLDGAMEKIVISYSADYPWAIAVDPINGTIYWTIFGINAKIEKSNYDSTNRQELFNSGLVNPYGLTIDIRAGVLYWCDYSTYMIERANVDGTNRQPIYHEQGTSFYKIALYQSHLYMTGYRQKWSVMRMETDGSNLVYVGPSNLVYSFDFYLHSTESASLGLNGCSNTTTDCSHFCFPRPGSLKVCACPDGLTLQSDGHTCRTFSEECLNSPCEHNGICINTNGTYSCRCPIGWQGENCSIDIDECNDYPCKNNGACTNTDGSFLCNCSRGWQGQNCSIDIDECDDYPCKNNGACTNTDGSYVCNCSRGWQGQNCSLDIDECDNHPCKNNGACTNTDGSYLCNCSRGWQGQNCSLGISFAFGEDANDKVLNAKDDACGESLSILPVPIFGRKYDTLYVCTNGLVSFQKEYTNPNPSDNANAYSGYSFLAPYYTDLDTSRVNNSGKVYYQLYDVLRDKNVLNNTNVIKTQELLNELEGEQSFQATMIFIATWYKNSPYPADKRMNESASFQLLLTTDGYNTFVMYIYFPGEMKLRQNNVFVGYHFNTGEFKTHLISFSSQANNIDMHVDTNGLTGLILYRLTSLRSSLSNFDIECLEWFEANQDRQEEYRSKLAEMPNCPCNGQWIMYDPWFNVPQQNLFNDVNTSCTGIAPSLKFSPHGKVCCFDNNTGAWISDSPRAGGFLKFNPITRRKDFESEDLRMKHICCERSNYCHLYYALRPVGDCYSTFPYEFALSWGDPHIDTLDSKTYTFNGWGEFTLISLQMENTSFVLQGRTDKARNKNGTLTDATVFTAFAARDNNNASIHIEISAERNGTYIYGNGVDYSVALANMEKEFVLSTENLTIYRAKYATTVNILFPSTGQPISLNVTVGVEMLTLAVTLPQIFKNKTKGLLGNYDGDPNNDFIYPNGTVLDGNATERTLFHYGISWTIDDYESVFIYFSGKSHKDFDHRNFTPKFFDEASQEQLHAASLHCGNNPVCTYDLLMTGNELVAANTVAVQETALIGENQVSNQIPSLRFEGKKNLTVTGDQQINLKFIVVDNGPVTFHFDTNTVDAQFVYTDNKSAEVNFTLGRDYQCALSVTAQDEQGYFAPSVSVDLIICDGCSQHGSCDLDTYQTDYGMCSFKRVKCICEPYWEGSSCQLDFDGCKGSPCSFNRSCTDVEASEHKKTGVAFMCSQCPQGYLKDSDKCLDIDECNEISDKCNQKCVNAEGSFSCECEEGFALSTDGRTCEDIDECERNLDNCDQICTNGVGNFTCGCFPGFKHNVSMNICIRTEVPNVCDKPAINCNLTSGCTSNNGSATCFCAKGFQLSNEGTKCLDIDECVSSPCSQSCSNFDGGFSCHCFQGYDLEKDKRTCVECKYPKYGNYCQETCNCGTHGVRCDPVKGCKCESGWEGNNCQQDIDECTQDPNICVDPYSLCENLSGTYTCQCVYGFKKNETGRCQDIDECSDPYFNKCSQLCINTLGGFTCGCEKGYQLDQKDQYKCVDVDECKIGTSGCEQICENVPGQFNCYCYYGYKLKTDRKTCEKEADVCAKIGSINCSHICLVENGKPACLCKEGYFLDTDRNTCKDINECETNTSCSQPRNCFNINGSFSCYCDDGYRLENDGVTCRECDKFHYGKNCNNTCNCEIGAVRCDKLKGCICKPGWYGPSCATDVNECLLNNSLCPGKHQKCINTAGSYTCGCENGYIRKSNLSLDCTDLDECEDSMLNTCDQNCNNTDGFYACTCNEGFKMQERRCVDVNECERPNACQHICDNLQGSYRCLCHTGFKVDVDNTTNCKPITECPKSQTELCLDKGAQCAISRGQAVCQCSKGFEWNRVKEECTDIKDCTVNARCNQICIEGIGGYTCACWDGYRLQQNNITCVACDNNTYGAGCKAKCECVHNNAGNDNQTCNHVNGTCMCKNGWEGICDLDIDECTRKTHTCQDIPYAGCHNTIGGYECSCLRGYVRQNNRCVADGSITSTAAPPPAVDEAAVAMSVKLDVAVEKGVNLNLTATYDAFSNAAKVALVGFYRQRLMDNLRRIVILSLAFGSLAVDYKIYILNSPVIVANLTLTNVELASGTSVWFQNASVGVRDVKVAGRLVPSKPSEEELCTIYQLSSATCSDGYICKVTIGLPSCRKNVVDDYYLTTALAAGIPFALLLIVAIIVFICLIKRRARKNRGAHDTISGNVHEETSTSAPDVSRLNTISGEKTNTSPGLASSGSYASYGKDDTITDIPWQISTTSFLQNQKFRIKRPAVSKHSSNIQSVD
ncbi:hypothetical protein CHS0354_031421 [Potamilus streckersoni]|uniref:Uncharacterized protein n=1 Tax=Potamilus streckersoni TaxID=2493646 RepID=A0AAE0RUR8_9BIVA|nr:hypothetical protein CHS0354_031421 [Potamilus streckersoni]